ncbi:C40 family peptidase [Streptomyces noursei]|uniref:C40 family peptidase n=1 Tax=Streptomyces noursei TaxID=1971 RepID=UPI0021554CA8|nr:bifunctional lytic transglycosylase/C40 family peptidase [Streptomyces noursei]
MKKLGCLVVLFGLLLFGIPLGLIAVVSNKPRQDTSTSAVAASAPDIPARMLQAYQNASAKVASVAPKCQGMTWAVVAGIAKVESDHAAGHTIAGDGTISPPIYGPRLTGSGVGGNTQYFADTDGGKYDGDPTAERAVGPFQFMPSTWSSSGQDGNADGRKDPQNADDAALSAAVYLCGRGRNLADSHQLHDAIYSYNHSEAYVSEVTGWIRRYAQLDSKGTSPMLSTGSAKKVIEAALSQVGVPYSWGGGNASGATTGICCSPGGKSGASIRGFDCSGLAQFAFAQVGVQLPRTAASQAQVGRRIAASQGLNALRPGDLVFFGYGADSSIYHVAIYLGSGQMLNAPRPGSAVRREAVWQDGFAGGARVI